MKFGIDKTLRLPVGSAANRGGLVQTLARQSKKPRGCDRGVPRKCVEKRKASGLLFAELIAHRVDQGLRGAVEVAPVHERVGRAACNHCVVDESSPDRDHDTQDERQKGAHTYSPSIRNGRNTPEKAMRQRQG